MVKMRKKKRIYDYVLLFTVNRFYSWIPYIINEYSFYKENMAAVAIGSGSL